jgi:hypothetical protein
MPALLISSPSSLFGKEKHFFMMLVRYKERDKAFMFFSPSSPFSECHTYLFMFYLRLAIPLYINNGRACYY